MKKIITTLFALAIAYSSNAQMATTGATPLNILTPEWRIGLSTDVSVTAELPADVSGLDGDLGVYETSANVKFQGAFIERHFITLSIDYTFSNYDFSSALAPFDDLEKVSAMLFYTGNINKRWGVFGLATTNFAADTDASMWGGKQMSIAAGATYAFNENFLLGAGLMAYSRVDKSWLGLPIAFADWKITQRLTLRTFSGIALFYDFFGDGKLILNITGEYRNNYYRLKDGNAGSERSMRDSRYQLSAGAIYNISKRAYLSAAIGGNFGRELEFRNNSNSAGEIDVDAAPFFTIHAGYTF